MTKRKIIAMLALTVGAATASLATPASALAAQTRTTAIESPHGCYTESNNGSNSYVEATICNGDTVTALLDTPQVAFTGHIEFYGPNGYILNTSDQDWKVDQSRGTSVNEPTNSGDLWCAELWAENGSGGYYSLDNNCVTV